LLLFAFLAIVNFASRSTFPISIASTMILSNSYLEMSKVKFEYAFVSFCFSKIFVKLCPVFEYIHLPCLVILSGSENSASTVAKYSLCLWLLGLLAF
jgi:predicted CDP-diglyceride synthetase/phosphatidate cytidylyltransferase